jgi:hypothetical protein
MIDMKEDEGGVMMQLDKPSDLGTEDPKEGAPTHDRHRDPNMPYHVEWELRNEAAILVNGTPTDYNFFPFATELRNWMLRKPDRLCVFVNGRDKYTNKYTYQASVLISVFQLIINDSAEFILASEPSDPHDAEIKRIRLYSENVLYTARICEALIKQLLFCTDFVEDQYKGAALGALLSKPCSGCRSEEKRHKLSLLGSLAHHYGFCGAYENCLDKHISIVNRRRNLKAAHTESDTFTLKTPQKARSQYEKEMTDVGEELLHMLQHIGQIETRMMDEMSRHLS